MKTYKITASTNSYIANRDVMFNGNTEVVLESGLTLKDAYKVLLDMYNQKFGNLPSVSNWGLAVMQSNRYGEGALKTFADGTRAFNFDSRTFSIVEE